MNHRIHRAQARSPGCRDNLNCHQLQLRSFPPFSIQAINPHIALSLRLWQCPYECHMEAKVVVYWELCWKAFLTLSTYLCFGYDDTVICRRLLFFCPKEYYISAHMGHELIPNPVLDLLTGYGDILWAMALQLALATVYLGVLLESCLTLLTWTSMGYDEVILFWFTHRLWRYILSRGTAHLLALAAAYLGVLMELFSDPPNLI